MNKKHSPKYPVLLDQSHDLCSFDCGDSALNNYLRQFAYINNRHGSSRTYVTCQDNQVIGYYTITIGSVSHEAATSRITTGMAPHRPIPVIILARLAIDLKKQGSGIGKGLLKDALIRATQGADIIGGRAILVHAKDRHAKDFYQKYGFEPSPIDDFHLYLLIKDIKKTLSI